MTKPFTCLRRTIASLAFIAAISLSSSQVHAGGPLGVCASGQPLLWPSGGVNIPFNPDQGTLGPLDHAQAVALVESAFGVWQAIPSCYRQLRECW
jgi:hypothetical protein